MPAIVILAAGMGNRYGGLKQIDPVGPHQQIILDYSVYDALQNGFSSVVFVIRKDIESELRKFTANRFEAKIPCTYVYQALDDLPRGFEAPSNRTKPWGTAHALWACRSVLKDPFAVINADDFYGKSAYRKLSQFLSGKMNDADLAQYAMVAFTLGNTLSDHGSVSRGVCKINDSNHLESVIERTQIEKTENAIRYRDNDGNWQPLTGLEKVSMNFWGLTPDIFPQLGVMFRDFLEENLLNPKEEYLLPVVVDNLIRHDQATVTVLSSEDQWSGITNPEDKSQVVDHIRMLTEAGHYPEKLWE